MKLFDGFNLAFRKARGKMSGAPQDLGIGVDNNIRSRSSTNYRVLQALGAGGNSTVYLVLATDKDYKGVLFALKVFTRVSNSERKEKFLQETEFLRNDCRHPAIMRIYDEGEYVPDKDETKAYPFVVAEYLPRTLADASTSPLSNAELLSCSLQLLSALAYLESRNPPVIHRDIKPKNIFVKGRSYVLGDFGLMKFATDATERDREYYVESTHGMPFYYRTPDLVEYAKLGPKAPLTTKSDVFQLGLVLAELFTGKNPERKASSRTDPVLLDEIGQVPGARGSDIRELINHMLEADADKRPKAADLMDGWDGFFRETVLLSHELNGRVF